MTSSARSWPLPVAILAIANIAGTWYKLVSDNVPDPYLDEVFHVPQAKRYCNGDYTWDPKITTPPGLYLVSLLIKPVLGGCDTPLLRLLNVGAICLICILAYDTLRILHARIPTNDDGQSGNSNNNHATIEDQDQDSAFNAHSALNISLFPPLFFFSGLYYTDVMSTLLVLLSYNVFLKRDRHERRLWDDFASVVIGALAVSFRQTNIFWVAVFPAGLAVFDALSHRTAPTQEIAQKTILYRIENGFSKLTVYDPPIRHASFMNNLVLLESTGLLALRRPFLIVKVIAPYFLLVGLFAGFVFWNGGVVLGDKSNHVATIHTPQMLYIWPYIAFFSLPLVVPILLAPIVRHLPEGPLKSFCLENVVGSTGSMFPSVYTLAGFIVAGVASVHYNTIIHPFTLADNRHYVFYVFRILRRNPALKYLAVPVYVTSAWVTIQTLGSRPLAEDRENPSGQKEPSISEKTRATPGRSSFILVWLATTALSVVSAPLVEPRYFIMPWLMWRLHVPSIAASPSKRSAGRTPYDMRLVLETIWHLAINTVVGYMFLHRGFLWSNEPGQIQRFLW